VSLYKQTALVCPKRVRHLRLKSRSDVTGRPFNRKDCFGVPYNPEIILDSGLSSDALNQSPTNRRTMLFLPVLRSGRHHSRPMPCWASRLIVIAHFSAVQFLLFHPDVGLTCR